MISPYLLSFLMPALLKVAPDSYSVYHAGLLLERQQLAFSTGFLHTNLPGIPDSENDTHIRFPNFEVIFYKFRAYETESDEYGTLSFSTMFAGTSDDETTFLVRSDSSEEEYIQTSNDTLILSENLDERINHTLLEIIPHSDKDRFKVTMYYESTLGEIIDDRNMTWEERDRAWENARRIQEHTTPIQLIDSARYFFRAVPHTPDMIEVTVKDGEIVPVNYHNTSEQIQAEQNYDEQEWNRIKTTYALHDTLVEIPGEYTTIAPLTDGKRLYGYGYDYYVFQIQRMVHGKLQETVYIRIGIAYGC